MQPSEKPVMTAGDYWALPPDERAELIDGELWDLAAPGWTHQEISAELTSRFRNHIRSHGGPCKALAAPFAVNLFADDTTIVEPDVLVVCDRGKLTERECKGAPDLAVEIVSPASRGMDYVTKLGLYREAGVREYWIVDPSMARTTVTRFEEDPAPLVYPFAEPVPAASSRASRSTSRPSWRGCRTAPRHCAGAGRGRRGAPVPSLPFCLLPENGARVPE